MKQIKKIVLRDATKLTNSEMKKIRGGYEPERSAVCSALCPYGYETSSVSQDCTDLNRYCDIVSGANKFGVGCFTPDGNLDNYSKIVYCEGTLPLTEI